MSIEAVTVVGGGGREYELGRQAQLGGAVVNFVSEHDGPSMLPDSVRLNIEPGENSEIVDYATVSRGLTVIGPEGPLFTGLSDQLRSRDLPVFGPSREAAMKVEGSRAKTIEFMRRHGLPHPTSYLADDFDPAMGIKNNRGARSFVIKADGPAYGKSVVIPENHYESTRALAGMFGGSEYGGAGSEMVIIQDRYHGPEVAATLISDGKNVVFLPFFHQYKRLRDGDQGPTTGGMGAFAPVPESIMSADQEQKMYEIAQQVIDGLAAEGTPYKGALGIGFMLAEETGGDPVILGMNARFADPGAQVVLPLLEHADVDLLDLMHASDEGRIGSDRVLASNVGTVALTVCLAAQGYPDHPLGGETLLGLEDAQNYENTILHFGAVKRDGDRLVTDGGRVLSVTGLGTSVGESATSSYSAIGPSKIYFRNMRYRTDIGIQKLESTS